MERKMAYAVFEQTILELYEQNTLTLDLLEQIASQYRQVSIDSVGSQYLRAHDGKDVQQICIGLVDPSFPIALPGSHEDHDESWEKELNKWEKIVRQHWGWQAYRG